jgi:hypothetical protein
MAQIRHIAIASDHPFKAAEFYKKAFGFREIARNGFDPSKPDEAPRPCSVLLTDGYLNIALLKLGKDQTGVGLDYQGLHHIGLVVTTSMAGRSTSRRWAHRTSPRSPTYRRRAYTEINFAGRIASCSTSALAGRAPRR